MTNWSNNVLYIGVTNNLQRRVFEHKSKTVPGFTSKYNLDKLVYFEEYDDIRIAIAREKQLKVWKRSKKNMLVNEFNPCWVDVANEIF